MFSQITPFWYYQTTLMDIDFDPVLALVFAAWFVLGVAVPLIIAPEEKE